MLFCRLLPYFMRNPLGVGVIPCSPASPDAAAFKGSGIPKRPMSQPPPSSETSVIVRYVTGSGGKDRRYQLPSGQVTQPCRKDTRIPAGNLQVTR